MRMENTCGMQHVGNLPFTGQYFRLEAETLHHAINLNASHHKSNSSIMTKPFLAPDAMIRQTAVDGNLLPSSVPTVDQAVARQLPASTTAATWRKHGDSGSAVTSTAQATIDAILASNPRPVRTIQASSGGPQTPSSSSRNGGSNTPDSGDKVYCTHWIRHGECDYIQQGCRYKHEMPNKATLASIGFRTMPRWWQEKVAVQLGHSAIPIVGAGLKPSEWMKTKPGTAGSGESSSGDDESDSDSDSDESEVESENELGEGEDKDENMEENDGIPSSPASTVESVHLAASMKPMMEQPVETSIPPSAKHTTEILQTMRSPQPTTIANTTTIRRPSLAASDLIDFSPMESTCETLAASRSSCPSSSTTAAHETEPEEIPSKLTVPSPAPTAAFQSEKKQNTPPPPTSSPPRRVFVPAGESKEYHIAHARRRNAAVSPSTEVPAVKFTLGGGKVREAVAAKQTKQQQHHQKAKHLSTTKKRPTLANFPSSGVEGLMASVHAPTPTPNATSKPTPTPTAPLTVPPPPPANSHQVFSPTTLKLQQQKNRLLQQAKKSKSGRASRSSVPSASPCATSSSSLTPKTPEVGNAKGVGEVGAASKQDRPVVPGACRPRRPAGMAGRDSRPRSRQVETKVAAGEAVRG